MSDDKSPLEKAVELAVYAPVGFVNFMRQMLPGWIEQGRQEVNKQVETAKVMGGFALSQGRQDAEKAVMQAAEVVTSITNRRNGATASRPAPPAAAPRSPAPTAPTESAVSTPSSAASPAPTTPSANGDKGPAADQLAIPGYDSLAASQVVQRLAGLSAAELEAVGRYESATRGRRTILNKVGQLQAER